MSRKSLFVAALVAFTLACAAGEASAQTVIWTVPTTDTAQPESKYVELDGIVNPRAYANSGYIVIGVRTLFGAGSNTEFGANLFGTKTSTPNPLVLQPNFKVRLWSDPDKGLATAAGTMLYIPVANRRYGDNFGIAYVVGSKKFNGSHGPRFSAGAWGLYGRQNETGSESGLMFGYEQPLTSKITLAIDHMTGDQVHGGFSSTTAGFITALSKSATFGLAYTRPNVGPNSDGVFGWVGFSF
jgi:hypothetical protein